VSTGRLNALYSKFSDSLEGTMRQIRLSEESCGEDRTWNGGMDMAPKENVLSKVTPKNFEKGLKMRGMPRRASWG